MTNTSPNWNAVSAMSLCVALLIASEFMPASLLTPMAVGLNATEGQAGQAISISGLFAVIASLLITTVAGRVDRKRVLVVLTVCMTLSLALIALAPTLKLLMTARAILGITIGGFWSIATAVLMRLVPSDQVPRALGIMYTGQAMAAAFAAPIGSYLGETIGWRGVFWVMVPLAVVTLVWQIITLPKLPTDTAQNFKTLIAVARRPHFGLGLIALIFIFGSAFSMFTYLRPFLEQVTGASPILFSALLLVLGCSGFIGTWIGGRIVGDKVQGLLITPPLVMGGATLVLTLFGTSLPMVIIALIVWGAMNTAISIIWFAWMSQNVPDAPEVGGSLMVAVIQLSIMLGAVIGGILHDKWSIYATFGGSITMALIAMALIRDGSNLLCPNTADPKP
jgi:predicted MFS family arabinose efflux permease